MAGYSATPLAKKLGLKDGMRVWWPHMPASVRAEIDSAGLSLVYLEDATAPVDAAHVFLVRYDDLEAAVTTLRRRLAPAGFLWASWPKKNSGVATEVDENVIRRVALPTGLVDTKVCAVDETWSGLKLVIRRELRAPATADATMPSPRRLRDRCAYRRFASAAHARWRMTTMGTEVYDAFLAAGAQEDRTAQALASFNKAEADLRLLKWMVGSVIGGVIALGTKTFF